MAAVSNNPYDEFEWVKKVIDSTTTFEQYQNTDRLIELFYKKYNNSSLYHMLTYHSIDHLENIEYNGSSSL